MLGTTKRTDGKPRWPYDAAMGSTGAEKPPRKLRLRYPASCVTCGIALSQGAEAIWDPVAKTVTCLACAPAGSLETGVAGASAAAEGKRRREPARTMDRAGSRGLRHCPARPADPGDARQHRPPLRRAHRVWVVDA